MFPDITGHDRTVSRACMSKMSSLKPDIPDTFRTFRTFRTLSGHNAQHSVVHIPKWDPLHHFNLKECYKPHAKGSSMVMCCWYIDICCCWYVRILLYTTTRNLRKTLFKAPGTCPCPAWPPLRLASSKRTRGRGTAFSKRRYLSDFLRCHSSVLAFYTL
jgi:hypothetical protein